MSAARGPRDGGAVEGYIRPDLYDLLYSWYVEDIPYYVESARAAGGPVLEVACGTGRVHLPMLKAGADLEGFDLQPGPLEVLRAKAAALGLTPRVQVADMRAFALSRRYALVVIPFNAFMHNLTTADQLATLVRCREHLRPGGRLVLDLFHPSLERLVLPDGEWHLERAFAHPESGAPLEYWSVRTTDRVNQTMQVSTELREMDARGRLVAVHPHGFALRWLYKAETELLLRAAGFARAEVAGGYDGRPLERDTDKMLWSAWGEPG